MLTFLPFRILHSLRLVSIYWITMVKSLFILILFSKSLTYESNYCLSLNIFWVTYFQSYLFSFAFITKVLVSPFPLFKSPINWLNSSLSFLWSFFMKFNYFFNFSSDGLEILLIFSAIFLSFAISLPESS